MEKIYQFLASACNSSRFFSGSAPESESDQEDSKVQIIIANLGKLTRIMFYLCKYSSDHCVTAITDMGILSIIEKLLKREGLRGKSATPALSETLSLLGALIPDSRSYKNDDSDYAKNEKNKSIIFDEQKGEVNDYRNTLVKSILPSMFKLYVSTFNQNLKFTFLQLIEEIILMLSGETLREHMQPYLFSRFVITTMKSDNYTWIEICLRIMQLLTDKKVNNCNLALQREGIKDYLCVYSDKEKFKELTGITITDEEEKQDSTNLFGGQANPIDTTKTMELQQPMGDLQEKPLNVLKEEPKVVELEENEGVMEKPIELEKTEQIEGLQKKDKVVEIEQKDDPKEVEEHKEVIVIETPTKPEEKAQNTEDTSKIDDDFHTPESAPKIESSSLPESKGEEEKKKEADGPLSMKVNQLKDQKVYLDDLKLAIRESMDEIEGMSNDLEDAVKSEIQKEELTLHKEAKPLGSLDYIVDPNLSQRKKKKMFIKRAIQNLDDNFEGIEDVG